MIKRTLAPGVEAVRTPVQISIFATHVHFVSSEVIAIEGATSGHELPARDLLALDAVQLSPAAQAAIATLTAEFEAAYLAREAFVPPSAPEAGNGLPEGYVDHAE